MAVVQIATKIDEDIRDKAANIFSNYGLDISTAVKIFISATVKEQRFPIDISKKFASETEYITQNSEWTKKIERAKKQKTGKIYNSQAEFRAEIEKGCGQGE